MPLCPRRSLLVGAAIVALAVAALILYLSADVTICLGVYKP